MSAPLWLRLAAPVLALLPSRALRRHLLRRLAGRTHRWLVRVDAAGRLRCRGLRLRLHGIAPTDDGAAIAGSFVDLLRSGPARLRVLGIDRDGGLAVLIRCGGRNLAVELLRAGLAVLGGSGARRLRAAQSLALIGRRGLWRWQPCGRRRGVTRSGPPPAMLFPWWQG